MSASLFLPEPSPEQDNFSRGIDSHQPLFVPSADNSLNSQPQQQPSASTSPPTNATRSTSPPSKPHPQPATSTIHQSPSPQNLSSSLVVELQQTIQPTTQILSTSTLTPVIDKSQLDPILSCPTSSTRPPPNQPQNKSELQHCLSETELKPTSPSNLSTLHPCPNSLYLPPPFQIDSPFGSSTADQSIKHLPPISPAFPVMSPTPSPSPGPNNSSHQPVPLNKMIHTLVLPPTRDDSQQGLSTTIGDRPSQPTLHGVHLAQASSSVPVLVSGDTSSNHLKTPKTSAVNKISHRAGSTFDKKFDIKAWNSRLGDIRQYLDQIAIAPKMASRKLGQILSRYTNEKPGPCKGRSTIPLDGRLEVILAIRYNRKSEDVPPYLDSRQ